MQPRSDLVVFLGFFCGGWGRGDRSVGSRGVLGAKGVVCIPPQQLSSQMHHNNSAASGDVGREEAAHLHRNGSRYEGVRSGMVSKRGRV